MLQSPPSVYHDSGFRLQTLMHGRNYLSPIQGASVPHQASVPSVDSPQYRGFICHPSSHHHRLPHFPLSIPPVDILPQYQPHHAGGLGQVGYPPPGLLSSGRPGHLQPSALDSYSQTLFNLSQQAHISPQTVVQQQVVRQTAAAGKGADDRGAIGARDVDGSDRFPLFGMIGYMKPFDGRFSDKNSAQDLSMKASGAVGHRLRHSQTTTTMTLKQHPDDSSTSPFCHSQCQSQKHHPQKSNNARIHGACETQRNTNNNNDDDDNDCCASNNRKEYFAVDKFKDEVGPSWRPTMPCPVYPMSSEMDFLSFKDPNSIGVHQPSDQRSYPRNGFTNNNNNNNYPSNTTTPAASASSSSSSSSSSSLSPSAVNNHGGTRSSPLTSASPSASSSHSLYPPASSSSARSPVAHHRHFAKGSVIQLASGQLKRVEDLTTEDFLDGRRVRDDLSVNTSRVTHVRLNHDNGTAVIGFAVGQKLIQVSVEAAVEHPFFVYNRGWSSCNPSKTLEHYGLPCLQLAIGDTCISLTHRYPGSPAPPASDNQPADEEEFPSSPKTRKSSKGYKMSPPCCNQSPEPQMVPGGVMVPPRRDDDGSQVVVSPETRLGPSGGLRVGRRKRRWSAPDNGSSAAERRTLAESPVLASYDPLEADQNVQSPVVLTVA